MIAKVRGENGFYDSIVFALFTKKRNPIAIVLDEKQERLIKIKLFGVYKKRINRNFIIYNADKKDWIYESNIKGYDWIIKNVSCLHKIKSKNIDLEKCKQLQSEISKEDWIAINNDIDIEGLCNVSLCFFNSEVKDFYEKDNKLYIYLDIPFECDILFELEGKIKTNLYKGFGARDDHYAIFDATLFLDNNLIYWVNDINIKNYSEFVNALNGEYPVSYFCAEKVSWKILNLR